VNQRATIDDQIETLKRRGVTFDYMSEEQARIFLAKNSYFFKIKSYEHNYPKIDSSTGHTYKDLDFGYLVELSLIDFALSRLVWSLCSNIEHSVKLRFNNLLMQDTDPDIGEKCVRRCWSGNPPESHDNPYTNDLRDSCNSDFMPWQLWELLGFNDQLQLYSAYFSVKGKRMPMKHLLFIVRKMRNAVSHGNCLLTDMSRLAPTKSEQDRTDTEVTSMAMRMCDKRVRTRGQRTRTLQQSLDSLVVNNYAAVLLCHLEFVEGAHILRHACDEVQHFINRLNYKRDEYFGDSGVITTRNHLIDSTLSALETLSKGYVHKAHKKAEELSANDPYRARQDTTEKINERIFRKHEQINRLKIEYAELETKAALLSDPGSLIASDYTSIDIETTGFSEDADRIIELGAVKFHNGQKVESFRQLVNPHQPLDNDVIRLTGITDEDLQSARDIDDVLPEFIGFIGGDILIGHNIRVFDSEFIRAASIRMGSTVPTNRMIDTLSLSKVLSPHETDHRLAALIRRLDIAQTEEHRAESDAMQTAQCYEVLKRKVNAPNTQ
jgi:DNA polymerase III epsilon subunit family exonuclease